MAIKRKKLTADEIKYVNILNRIYNTLTFQKAKWTCNLRNGKNINSTLYPSFDKIPNRIRRKIVTFRFHVGNNRYTINTKVNDFGTTKYLKGFFYHQKAGHQSVISPLPTGIPFVEERTGFCYNLNGDAFCIYISHYKFINQIGKRRKKIKLMFGDYKPYQELYPLDKKGKDSKRLLYVEHTPFHYSEEVHKIISAPITYDTQVSSWHENINGEDFFLDGSAVPIEERPKRSVKINIPMFFSGSLEDLEDSTTPPRLFENNQEIVILGPHI